MSNPIKIGLVAILILALIGVGYWYSTSGASSTSSNSPLQSSAPTGGTSAASAIDPQDAALGDKFLALLLNMRTIKLDPTLFSDPAFSSLRDFTTDLPPEADPGRVNPFAPLGQDAAAPTAITVTTGTPNAVTKTGALFIGAIPAGAIATQAFFEYGTTSTPPLPNTTAKVQVNPATGVYTFPIATLTPSTTYYVRAAAQINGAMVYGSVQTFQTPSH